LNPYLRFVGEYDKVVLCRLLVFSFYILVDVENSEDIPLAAAGKNNGGIAEILQYTYNIIRIYLGKYKLCSKSSLFYVSSFDCNIWLSLNI
jgi:hypothetical protein